MEFRCFVRNRKLLCISQRDRNFYPFIHDLRPEIRRLIVTLFGHLGDFESDNWVFDIYIPRTKLRAHLIDINPFAPRTDPGLFQWPEILNMSFQEEVEVRLVDEGDRRIEGMEFTAQRVPMEVVEASQGKTVAEFAAEWEKLVREEQ
jgi:D123